MLENLLQKWASLAPRDRRMLLIAGCFLLVIIFWQVLLEPAWVGSPAPAEDAAHAARRSGADGSYGG